MTATRFDYVRSTTLEDVADRIGERQPPYAGGTDLLPRIRSGIDRPERLVDIKNSGLTDTIEVDGTAAHLGALTTLSRIADAHELGDDRMVLRRSAAVAATTQIRNRATIAGNLLQRPRCPYFRHADRPCWLNGGDRCHARYGFSEQHAIFDTDRPCIAVHPSDPANALLALDARLSVRSGVDTRTVPIAEFFRAPTPDRRIEHSLAVDDLITGIHFELPTRSAYAKAMDRARWAFALVAVAVVLRSDGPDGAMVVAGGVANTPLPLPHVASVIASGGPIAELEAATREALADASPLEDNTYKCDLLVGALLTAYEELVDG